MGQIINDITTTIKQFSGAELNDNDIAYIVLCAMLIILAIVLIYFSLQTLFWIRIGWAFEDLWHWLKTRRCLRCFFDPRYSILVHDPTLDGDDLTEEDIHEIMDIIYKGNPPKYEIKRDKAVSNTGGNDFFTN